MKKTGYIHLLLTLALTLSAIPSLWGHDPRARTAVQIPDILEYRTLKCDFHIHTVFSDGSVWPDIRSEEAWREGLDAIAITDHIEYQPHKDDLPTNHERSYQIAKPHGDQLRIIVIRGSEVTREMPPGHINAIFLDRVTPLDTEEWRDSLKEARAQGAFLFWNHPGWDGQQPDNVARWYSEHSELVDGDLLHGIEVANAREYYPEAHRWCLEKNLTMLSNSDVHNPLNLDYHVHHGDHRPLTLVFSKDASSEGIREALFDRRTAVYTGNRLIGRETFLQPIFQNSITVINPQVQIVGDGRALIQIQNDSDLDYELVLREEDPRVGTNRELILQGGKTVLLTVAGRSEERSGTETVHLQYTVKNLLVAPDVGMAVDIPLEITFVPEKQEPGQ